MLGTGLILSLLAILVSADAAASFGERHDGTDVARSRIVRRHTDTGHRRHLPYSKVVLLDEPIVYWRLNDPRGGRFRTENLGTAGHALDGIIEGHPEFQTNGLVNSDVDTAMLFTGAQREVVRIPNSTELNAGKNYSARTIELWFKPSAMTSAKQTIYDEGDGVRGISMFVQKKEGFEEFAGGPGTLSMFVYDRSEDSKVQFGTESGGVNWGPITCDIKEGETYYVALVFEGGESSTPRYSGYYKRPGPDWTVHPCGTVYLPQHAVLGGHAEPPCLGNICGTTRHSPTEIAYNRHNETDHDFHGTIDEVAIYNIALHHDSLNIHAASAMA